MCAYILYYTLAAYIFIIIRYVSGGSGMFADAARGYSDVNSSAKTRSVHVHPLPPLPTTPGRRTQQRVVPEILCYTCTGFTDGRG